MTSLTQNSPSVSPNVITGLLLAARTTLRQLDLPHPSVAQILAATSAGRTRAYEYKTLASFKNTRVQWVARLAFRRRR